ncbi:MAG: UDP-N-acetylmuramate--L-alanine ligase [bacterium]
MFESYRVIHFTGIGGIGMSGIAELLHNLGYEVTGSDIKESETTKRLRGLGMTVHIGHRMENITNAHVVVISSAVKKDNPEVIAAEQQQIPVIPRAEMLAELCRLKYSILIAGAHGKTTTTSLVSSILTAARMDPTVVIGGRLKATGANAVLGKGNFIVAEADESDGSFLMLTPAIAVATNIDREHMEYFGSIDALKEAFISFLNKVPFYGSSILCIDNPFIREILPELHRRYITYGFTPEADIYAHAVGHQGFRMEYSVVHKGKDLGTFVLPLIGKHNVLNSLAAVGVAMELKVPVETISESLRTFSGIQRRFELKGETRGIRVFDDYGHHPTEITAILSAARMAVEKKIHVVFQPHRYTRTQGLMTEFSSAFGDADRVYVLDIYPAGEKPIEGVSAAVLTERIRTRQKNASYEKDAGALLKKLREDVKPGDVVITLGAGDVYKIGESFLGEAKDA